MILFIAPLRRDTVTRVHFSSLIGRSSSCPAIFIFSSPTPTYPKYRTKSASKSYPLAIRSGINRDNINNYTMIFTNYWKKRRHQVSKLIAQILSREAENASLQSSNSYRSPHPSRGANSTGLLWSFRTNTHRVAVNTQKKTKRTKRIPEDNKMFF